MMCTVAVDWGLKNKFNIELEYIDKIGWKSINVYQRKNSCLRQKIHFLNFYLLNIIMCWKRRNYLSQKGWGNYLTALPPIFYRRQYTATPFSDIFHCAGQHYWTGAARGRGVALSANQENCGLEDFFLQFTDAQFPWRKNSFKKFHSHSHLSEVQFILWLSGIPCLKKLI